MSNNENSTRMTDPRSQVILSQSSILAITLVPVKVEGTISKASVYLVLFFAPNSLLLTLLINSSFDIVGITTLLSSACESPSHP
jgi:hypothetical protein